MPQHPDVARLNARRLVLFRQFLKKLKGLGLQNEDTITMILRGQEDPTLAIEIMTAKFR